jgi:hypothetical protein
MKNYLKFYVIKRLIGIDKSCKYEDFDYAVFIQLFYALITKAKMTEIGKNLAQNLI